MPSGLKLKSDKPKELARFEIVVSADGSIAIPDEFAEKYGVGNLLMWSRSLAFNLESAINAMYIEEKLAGQLGEVVKKIIEEESLLYDEEGDL